MPNGKGANRQITLNTIKYFVCFFSRTTSSVLIFQYTAAKCIISNSNQFTHITCNVYYGKRNSILFVLVHLLIFYGNFKHEIVQLNYWKSKRLPFDEISIHCWSTLIFECEQNTCPFFDAGFSIVTCTLHWSSVWGLIKCIMSVLLFIVALPMWWSFIDVSTLRFHYANYIWDFGLNASAAD